MDEGFGALIAKVWDDAKAAVTRWAGHGSAAGARYVRSV